MASALIRSHCEDRDTKKTHLATTEAETGVKELQTKERQDQQPPPEARKRQGRIPPRDSEGARLCGHLAFGLSRSSTVKEYVSIVLSSQCMYFATAALGN